MLLRCQFYTYLLILVSKWQQFWRTYYNTELSVADTILSHLNYCDSITTSDKYPATNTNLRLHQCNLWSAAYHPGLLSRRPNQLSMKIPVSPRSPSDHSARNQGVNEHSQPPHVGITGIPLPSSASFKGAQRGVWLYIPEEEAGKGSVRSKSVPLQLG